MNCRFLLIVLLVTLCTTSNYLHAQKPKLAIQTGHSQPINDLQFSPESNLLASCSSDGSIILWDIFTGKQLTTINNKKASVNSISIHPTQKLIASGNQIGELLIHEYPSGKKIYELPLMKVIKEIVFSLDGNTLLVVGDQACIFNLDNYTTNYLPYKPQFQFECCAISNDGKMFAIGGSKENKTIIINSLSKEILLKVNGKSKSLSFDQTDKILFAAGINGKLLKWNLAGRNPKPRFTIPSNRIWQYYTSVIANQQLFAAANKNGYLYLYKISNGKKIATLSNHNSEITSLSIASNKQMIASADRNHTIAIWDVDKMDQLKQLNGNAGKISTMSFDSEGKALLIGYLGGNTTKFYLEDFTKTINYQNKKSLKDEIFSWNYSIQKIEESKENQNIQKVIAIKYKLDKKKNDKIKKQKIISYGWNLTTNKRVKFKRFNARYYTPSALMDTKRDYSVTVDSLNQLRIQNKKTNQVRYLETGHTDIINGICINPKYNYVATSSSDGFIKLFHLTDPKLLLSIALFNDNNYIFVDSATNYFASKGAYQYIGFALNEKYLFLDQFDIVFNRPHEVLSHLEIYPSELINAYQNAYLRRIQYSRVKEITYETENKIPQFTIINKKQLPLKTNAESVLLQLEVSCSNCEIVNYQVLVNGVPIQGTKGFSTQGKSSFSIEVQLSEGENKIDGYCISDEGIESYRDVISITKNKSNNYTKPVLHFIPISISEYKDQNYNLKYAAKDGRDLANLFSSKKSDYIINTSDSFINQAATRETIKKVKQKLLNTTVNDIVIVFLSGHGLLDTSYNFWFATYDINFKKPAEKGLSFAEIEWLMDSIPARKKLILMDACHSGEFDKNAIAGSSLVVKETKSGRVSATGTKGSELLQDSNSLNMTNTFELMQQLFSNFNNGSGTQIVSAAAGNSYAFESETWQNGVFTYSIIQGLKNKKSDLNKNGKVSISELTRFVSKEVQQLTNGAQKPTSRKENQDNDWNIW